MNDWASIPGTIKIDKDDMLTSEEFTKIKEAQWDKAMKDLPYYLEGCQSGKPLETNNKAGEE